MGMMYERQLAIPAELKEMYPLTAKMNETIQTRRAELKRFATLRALSREEALELAAIEDELGQMTVEDFDV